jgi:hypothetical protein
VRLARLNPCLVASNKSLVSQANGCISAHSPGHGQAQEHSSWRDPEFYGLAPVGPCPRTQSTNLGRQCMRETEGRMSEPLVSATLANAADRLQHLVYRRWIICRRASSLTGRSFSRRVERTDRAVLWIPEFMPIVLALRGLNQGLVVGTGRRMVIQSTLGEARRRMKSFPTVCGRAALIKRFFSPQIRGTTKAPVPDNRSHIGLEFGLRRRGQQPCKPPGGTPNPEISEETQAPIHPPVRPYRSFFFLRTLWDATKPVPVSRVESFTSDERPAGPA